MGKLRDVDPDKAAGVSKGINEGGMKEFTDNLNKAWKGLTGDSADEEDKKKKKKSDSGY